MAHCMDFRRNIYLSLQGSAKPRAVCCSTRSQEAREGWAGRGAAMRPLRSPSSRTVSRLVEGGCKTATTTMTTSVGMIDSASCHQPSIPPIRQSGATVT